MEIVKKINNNVAIAKDDKNRDLVVFGKGIGFPPMPYTLTDLNRIQRTFYDIKSSYVALAVDLPEDLIMLAADIVELAQFELDCTLNPNLPFTLADHLHFAFERLEHGMELQNPLSYDVAHLYPREMELSRQAIELIEQRKEVRLPDCELTSLTLHLVNGELENSDMSATLKASRVIGDITEILERELDIVLDREAFNYSRFVMHIRYLIQRLEQGNQEEGAMDENMLKQFLFTYPDVSRCADRILKYLEDQWGWHCTKDEELFLVVHINRVKEHSGAVEQ